MLADEIRSYCGSAAACEALGYLAHYGMLCANKDIDAAITLDAEL